MLPGHQLCEIKSPPGSASPFLSSRVSTSAGRCTQARNHGVRLLHVRRASSLEITCPVNCLPNEVLNGRLVTCNLSTERSCGARRRCLLVSVRRQADPALGRPVPSVRGCCHGCKSTVSGTQLSETKQGQAESLMKFYFENMARV